MKLNFHYSLRTTCAKAILLLVCIVLYANTLTAQVNLPYNQSFSITPSGWTISGNPKWSRNSTNNDMEVELYTGPLDTSIASLQTPYFNLKSINNPELIFYYRIDSDAVSDCQPYLELGGSTLPNYGFYLQDFNVFGPLNYCKISGQYTKANTWTRYSLKLLSIPNLVDTFPTAFVFNVDFYGYGRVHIDNVQLQDGDFPEGITNVSSPASLSIVPNPCSQCEVYGDINAADLAVIDILGRKVSATFAKTSQGYQIQLPERCKGLFLVRDIKTGEVIKFMKE